MINLKLILKSEPSHFLHSFPEFEKQKIEK